MFIGFLWNKSCLWHVCLDGKAYEIRLNCWNFTVEVRMEIVFMMVTELQVETVKFSKLG